ncbi:dapdiamide synthesis protein DdaC-like [Glandiceps talaboti]
MSWNTRAFNICVKTRIVLWKMNVRWLSSHVKGRREHGNVKTEFVYDKRVEIPVHSIQPRIAGRQWLPGSTYPSHKLPEYLPSPKDNKPALYAAVASNAPIENWADKARQILDEKLHIYGCILFRGLPLQDADDFSQFVEGLGYTFANLAGATGSRHKVGRSVYTASDNNPPSFTQEPHNEMAYMSNPPMKVFFYCNHPPTSDGGGETVIADVRDIIQRLDKDILEKFERLGMRYYSFVRCKSDKDCHRSWQETFRTNDKVEAESYMKDNGFEFRWRQDNSLSYWYHQTAFRNHHLTGERVWFNQATVGHSSHLYAHPKFADKDVSKYRYPYHCTYGDGSEIEPDVLQHIRDALWKDAVGFQLQKSDVLAFDNIYAQHGKMGFSCRRELFVSLTAE